ncbi:RNA-directed DNA polymerase, eukaryota [Tanacetum coccineum]
MGSLHLSFSRAVNEGIFKGVHLNGSITISHLFYADDAMFIGEWSDANLKGIINILQCFFLASGLKINIHKSQVLGVGIPSNIMKQAAASLGCGVLLNQFRYLGVMVGKCMSRHQAWEDMVLKLRSRLSKWKVKTLSIGGRLTLLKSVLGASPLYYMSIFKVPKGILKIMESIRSNFFNGFDSSDRKITWAAWDKILASKKNGGLGVSRLYALNTCTLLNAIWRFVLRWLLWFRVIQALFGSDIVSHSVTFSSTWCSIVRELRLLLGRGFDFLSFCKRRIGDGKDKEILVADKLKAVLDHSFRRPARNGHEHHQLEELCARMDLVSLSQSYDRWVCDLSGDGVYRVSVVRNFLDNLFLPSYSEPTRWIKYIPIKINVFAWRARRDYLPTRVNLNRRGIILESYMCPLCHSVEEDITHVLFRCDLAKIIVRRISRWWDLDWQDIQSFPDWFTWLSSIRLSVKLKNMLEGVFYVAWWCIWGLRNRTIFNETPPRRSVIFDDIVSYSFTWCSSRCNKVFSWDS